MADLTTDGKTINFNSVDIAIGYYNLIVCKSQLSLYHKSGMIPYRGWKITALKVYFGIKGNAGKMTEQLIQIKNELDNLK